MNVRKITAAVAALMLSASPVVAQSAGTAAPKRETVREASSLAGTNTPLGALVGATILGVILYILVRSGDDESPSSP